MTRESYEGYPCSGCGRTIVSDTRCWQCGGRGIRPIPIEYEDDVPSTSYLISSLVLAFTATVAAGFVVLTVAHLVFS